MNTPHTHPRAAEMLFSVNGTIQSGFLDENGARFVASTVPAGTGTIYPQVGISGFVDVCHQLTSGCFRELSISSRI